MKATHRTRALRVLVVDDDRDCVDSLAVLLKLWGFVPLAAYGAAPGLEAALTERPDVILLDIGLPGMDGYEIARRIRVDAGLAGVLLVALTGYGQEEDRRLGREAGFDLHLIKPVDLDLLEQVLDAASRKG